MESLHPVSQKQFASLVGVSQPSIVKAVRNGRLVDTGSGIDLEHPSNVAYAELHASRRASKGLPASPWTRGERAQGPVRVGRPPTKKAEPKPKPIVKAKKPQKKATKVMQPNDIIKKPNKKNTQTHAKAPQDKPVDRTIHPMAGARPETVAKSIHALDEVEKKRALETEIKRAKLEQERLKIKQTRGTLIQTELVTRSISHLGAVLEDHFRSFGERTASSIVAAVLDGKREGAIADMLDSQIDRGVNAFKKSALKEIEGWDG